ncbi:MAG: aminopeptidase P family protein [Bacteroidota bacterium]
MFDKKIYTKRREKLKSLVKSGIILFPGNNEAPFNYPSNTYHFRQDSSFLYFFGLDKPGLSGIIDVDKGDEILFGDDPGIDDIIWMGPQPLLREMANEVGVDNTQPTCKIESFIRDEMQKKRKIHLLPPYRAETKNQLETLLMVRGEGLNTYISGELIKAVVHLRSVKDEHEIREIEKAVDITSLMHTTVMKMARPGMVERELSGTIEGISLAHGGPVSFPVILSMNGETLHNHYHGNILEEGRLLLTDAGAETTMHYAGDITRTIPVSGKFTRKQKEVYQIVVDANMKATEMAKPGITYKEVHLAAARVIANGLKMLGIMRGNPEEAVAEGAHALFFPHGLGHMMGLDVHDMEGLGEDHVGYDNETKRSQQFGLAYLRLGRKLEKNFVLTNEPGIYFIPALISQWENENKFTDFINYNKVKEYLDFGGIRIEDDLLITGSGSRVLGKPVPKTITEIESYMQQHN